MREKKEAHVEMGLLFLCPIATSYAPVFPTKTAEAASGFFAGQGKFLQKSLVYFKKI